MSDVFTTAGTQIFVKAALPNTYNQVGFEALTDWILVGEIADAGEYGRVYNMVSWNSYSARRTVKRKGSYNDGTLNLQLGRLPNDAGQQVLLQYLDLDESLSIKVILQDGTIQYFSCQVFSYTSNLGNLDQITQAACQLEIDNDIIEVAAAGGIRYTLEYEAGANGTLVGFTTQSVASGADGTAVFAFADSGYVFQQWSDANTDNPRVDENVTEDISVTAIFVLE